MRIGGFGWSLCPGTASVPGSEDAGELLLLYLPVVVFFFNIWQAGAGREIRVFTTETRSSAEARAAHTMSPRDVIPSRDVPMARRVIGLTGQREKGCFASVVCRHGYTLNKLKDHSHAACAASFFFFFFSESITSAWRTSWCETCATSHLTAATGTCRMS